MSLGIVGKAPVMATGRVFFGIGTVGMGAQHFFFGNFVPMVIPVWPAWMEPRLFWIYLVGTALVAAGVAVLSGVKARLAAVTLGMFFLLSFVLLHVPFNITHGVTSLGGWTGALKAFAFSGGAFVIAGTYAEPVASDSILTWLEKLIPLGVYPIALMMIAFGTDHFLYVPFVASLVPAWIPLHVFWTYFAGVALIASGVGILVKKTAALAGTLLGTMLFVWVLVLHIPRAVADPYGAIGNEWTSVFQALAFSGVAFILGETLGAGSNAAEWDPQASVA